MSALKKMDEAKQQQALPTTITGMLKDARFVSKIQQSCAKHMTADKVAGIAMGAVRKNPKLQKCDPVTLFGAVLEIAQMGLEIGPRGCYILPFENRKRGTVDVTVIPSYQGLLKLALQSDQVLAVYATEVCAHDDFDYSLGLDTTLVHRPKMSGRGNLVGAYAVATLAGGIKQFEVMDLDAIDAIMKRSKSSNNGPWQTDKAMMARKTVIKRLLKVLDSSSELDRAIAVDDGQDQETLDMRAWHDGAIDGESEVVKEKPAAKKAPAKKRGTPTKIAPPVAQEPDAPITEQEGMVPPPTYAEIAQAINDSADEASSRISLDMANGNLPANQIAELVALHVGKWKAVGE
jgi:recombination protein RecT